MNMWLKVILYIVIFLILAYLFLRWFERANIWMPSGTLIATPETVGLSYEDVFFTAEDGVTLHGWFVPHEDPVAAVVFCHGNGGNLSYRTECLRQFNKIQLSTFIFDYRGYGKSEGFLTEEGTYQDAVAAYQWLKKKEPELPILLFGRSLGANVAVELARRVDAAGLIYESGFNSVQDLGSEIFPFLPVRWVTKYKYNALEKIKDIQVPLLVIHSRQDEIIPFHHGQKLYEAAPSPKQFLEVFGGHNDGFIQSESHYLEGIRAFIENCVSK